MKISASKAPVSRLVLAGAISAIFLLLTAACARGEAVDDGVASLASGAEGTPSLEQAPTPPTAPPAEAPAETPAPENAIESVGTTVETVRAAVDGDATAPPVSVPAASETVRQATSKLTGKVGQLAGETAAEVGDQTRRLSEVAGTPSSRLLSSPGESPVFESPASRDEATHANGVARRVGVLPRPRLHVGGVSSLPGRYSGFPGAEPSWLGALEIPNGIQSTPVRSTVDARSSDPVPLDVPMPARGSFGAAAGSTGSFFVPFAALLALLALVAPAILRRLGGVPAFRPPIPFVCALERPG